MEICDENEGMSTFVSSQRPPNQGVYDQGQNSSSNVTPFGRSPVMRSPIVRSPVLMGESKEVVVGSISKQAQGNL